MAVALVANNMTEFLEDVAGGEMELGQTSVSKALTVLEALATLGSSSVTRLAAEVRLPKSTTHRLLKVLEEHGFSGRSGSNYCVGPQFLEMRRVAHGPDHEGLRDVALPALEWLFESTQTTVHLGVLLSDGDVLYIEKITGSGGCRIPSRVGGCMPATCTALGKAMLAHSSRGRLAAILNAPLPRVTARSITVPKLLANELLHTRQTGLAYDREEARPGLFCVAAPVVVGGRPVAAVSCGGVRSEAELARLAPYVTKAASWIARQVGE